MTYWYWLLAVVTSLSLIAVGVAPIVASFSIAAHVVIVALIVCIAGVILGCMRAEL